MKRVVVVFLVSLVGCAAAPQIAVDPQSITDRGKYESDMRACEQVAQTYDLGGATEKSALAGAAVGGATVAGVAVAVAGAVFAPAIPFIIAGSAAGGGAAAGWSKNKETKARESILARCMTERGYKAYTSN